MGNCPDFPIQEEIKPTNLKSDTCFSISKAAICCCHPSRFHSSTADCLTTTAISSEVHTWLSKAESIKYEDNGIESEASWKALLFILLGRRTVRHLRTWLPMRAPALWTMRGRDVARREMALLSATGHLKGASDTVWLAMKSSWLTDRAWSGFMPSLEWAQRYKELSVLLTDLLLKDH